MLILLVLNKKKSMNLVFWIDNFKGELAALTAAFLWAVSSIIYGILGQKISPLPLNFAKGSIAILMISIAMKIVGETRLAIDPLPIAFLLLSGAIGIGLGDTAYFSAINYLGARKTLLIETLAPPISALLALIFLGERLNTAAWCGILVTILGVAWVITERTSVVVDRESNVFKGVVWAILAAIAQATGAVLSRFALIESNITTLWSTQLRLIAGVAIVFLLMLIVPQQREKTSRSLSIIFTIKSIVIIAITAFGSTFLGIWLQQTSLKFAATGIAQTLSATSPLFILPIVAVMGDRISLRTIFGVLVAIAGITLLLGFRS